MTLPTPSESAAEALARIPLSVEITREEAFLIVREAIEKDRDRIANEYREQPAPLELTIEASTAAATAYPFPANDDAVGLGVARLLRLAFVEGYTAGVNRSEPADVPGFDGTRDALDALGIRKDS